MGSFVAGDISALTTSVTSLTGVTWPAHGGDDLALLAHAYGDGTNTGTMDAAFTNIADLTDTNLRAVLGKRIPSVMTGSESGDVTLTTVTGARQVGALAVYTGYSDVRQVVNQPEASGTAQTTHTSPAITPQVAGSGFVIVYMDRVSAGNTTVTPPAGFTKRLEFGTVGTGGVFMCVADDLSGTHGLSAFTPGDWIVAVGSTSALVYLIELGPVLEAAVSLTETAAITAAADTAKPIAATRSTTATIAAAAGTARGAAAAVTATAARTATADVIAGTGPVVTVQEEPRPRSFRIEVFDENLNKLGRVGRYLTADLVLKHLAVGSWSILMNLDEPAAALLAQPGRRVTIDFEEDGSRLLSGPMDSFEEIAEVDGQRTIAFAGYDDKWWLDQRLAFPTPGATFPAEGVSFTQPNYVDIRTGTGEAVAKAFVTANAVTRYAIPHLVVAPSLGRGTTVTFNARMHSLLWMVTIATTYSGIGFKVDQVGNQLVFDVYTPQAQPVRLSTRLGNLAGYRYKELSPTATDAVGGGTGDGTLRKYMQKSRAASAVGWGHREKYVDLGDAATDAELSLRITDYLIQSAPTAGFSLTPRDTRSMRFGRDYNVGDNVTVELPSGLQVADTVREVRLSHTTADGMVITPGIGYSQATDPTAEIYRRYAALRDDVANMKRRV